MISIVLVSHSRRLAEGLLDLLRQVTPPSVQAAQAAGVGPDRAEIGTDAVHIAEVIQSVFSADGVLVLVDLGSAILNAEMALELLPDEMRGKVLVCPAPFVEGALAAGVQAGLGSDLHTVCRESQQALAAKTEQLSSPGAPPPGPAGEAARTPDGSRSEAIVTIRNPYGLHLRPAALLVQAAARFAADVRLWNLSAGLGPAPARSINALAILNARPGDEVKIQAVGADAEEAIRSLEALVRQNFGEGFVETGGQDTAAVPAPGDLPIQPPDTGPGKLHGLPVSAGVAVAPLYHFKPAVIWVERAPAADPETEWRQLEQALHQAKETLRARQAVLEQRTNGQPAGAPGILAAQRLVLEDPELLQQARRRVFEQGLSAASAWSRKIQELADRYRALADPYLKQRAADVEDAGRQVLALLAGAETVFDIPGDAPVILATGDLAPSEAARLDPARVAGLVTASGGETAHSAILARALGIPAVSGVDLSDFPDGLLLALDGGQGLVIIDPPPDVQESFRARGQARAAERAALLAGSHAPARLKNGRRIEVMANIGSLSEAKLAAAQGADGVGLLRTEFLFLSRAQPPPEEEQEEALRAVGQALEGRPVIVRTLDAGGDKEIPYLKTPGEANPFLGVRAIRLALRHPDLFQAQLRAILKAAGAYPLRILFPMVASTDDLRRALEQLELAHASLDSERAPHRWPLETGIMIEIPSAALLSDRLAPLVDFFSIGTNDLTQYTLAADRGSPALAEYSDALHPAVLCLIRQVVESGKRYGKPVGVCGELAADPLAAPVLVGLGLDEFSLNPAAIPEIKAAVRELEDESASRLAERVLLMDSAASVRQAAREFLATQSRRPASPSPPL